MTDFGTGGCRGEDFDGVDSGERAYGFTLLEESACGECVGILSVEGICSCEGIFECQKECGAVVFSFGDSGGIHFAAPGTASVIELLLANHPGGSEEEQSEAACGEQSERAEESADAYGERCEGGWGGGALW